MARKQNKLKQARKEAQRANPIHWEQDWIEQVLPTIQDFANVSTYRRFKDEIADDDRVNWTWGSDVDVQHAERKVIVTEWLVPVVDGKGLVYLDEVNGVLNPSMRAYKYTLRYDHLQQAARHASKTGGAPNIGLYYLPDVTILPGEKGWEHNIELYDEQGKFLVTAAVTQLNALKAKLVAEHGALSDEGIYMGVCMVYNRDENLIQLVTHKRHALDVMENKDGEINYIDLNDIKIDEMKFDQDTYGLNVRSAVERHVEAHRVWDRIIKPSEAAYKRFSCDLADYLMSITEEVYKRACASVPNVVDVKFEYNLMNGGLEAYHIGAVVETDEAGNLFTEKEERYDIELSREDRAAILMVAGRIEPDLWFHVQADYLRRFLATYGKGDVTVSDTVLTSA